MYRMNEVNHQCKLRNTYRLDGHNKLNKYVIMVSKKESSYLLFLMSNQGNQGYGVIKRM